MGRILVILATALAPMPLLCLGGMAAASALPPRSAGSDRAIAASYLALLAGGGLALVGGAAAAALALRLGTTHARPLLLGDGAALLVGLALWARLLAPAPALSYADRTPRLEVEVRVPEASLAGAPIADAVAVDFVGGADLDLPHPDLARFEDGYAVLPWETAPIRVEGWEVQVHLRGRPSLFRLDLPRRPAVGTDWSAWLRPSAADGFETPQQLELRYRFRLDPPTGQ